MRELVAQDDVAAKVTELVIKYEAVNELVAHDEVAAKVTELVRK